jgi:LytS/YehU family sensor histidine kinase
MVLLFGFKVAGAWRQTLLPRWVAQLLAVALGAALSPLIVQMLSVGGDFSAFLASRPMVHGYVLVTLSAALIGSLFALGALYRERDAQARAEALQFALERETLQRQAADARLRLLTAQIEPHFLLNTLANVQQLVESGSPRAAPVFRSLIDYLRAALPQLHQQSSTLGDEERLVRAYLELMLMRMPDRLAFTIAIEPPLRTLAFPPMALLTLVENAIRHGIDPACDGGRIEVGARPGAGRDVHLWVADTGVGLTEGAGTGTGLRNLQERLEAFFGPGASVTLSGQAPHGVRADIHVASAEA